MGYEFIPVNALDWGIIIGFLVFTLIVGIIVSKKAGESSEDFFLSGRSMPWWLLGFSMVATQRMNYLRRRIYNASVF